MRNSFLIKSITQKDVLEFNKNLSTMLLAKLSLTQCFEVYINKIKNIKFREVLKKIHHDLKTGSSLSKSMNKYPTLFPEIYIANLKIAEETGEIARILGEYTLYQEKMYRLKKKIIESLRYPALVLVVASGVVSFMVFFLIPTFQSLFFNTKMELPAITQIIINISFFIKNNIIYVLLILIITIFLIRRYKNSLTVKNIIDSFLLKAIVISTLYKKNLLARFAYSMSILLNSKVSLVESLSISKKISTNKYFQEEISNIKSKITRGERLSSNFNRSKIFDPTFTMLLTVGEESAELGKVFQLIGEYYQEEFDYRLEGITSLFEPILILFVGMIVAVILIAMYLPMFEIINNFGV